MQRKRNIYSLIIFSFLNEQHLCLSSSVNPKFKSKCQIWSGRNNCFDGHFNGVSGLGVGRPPRGLVSCGPLQERLCILMNTLHSFFFTFANEMTSAAEAARWRPGPITLPLRFLRSSSNFLTIRSQTGPRLKELLLERKRDSTNHSAF